MYQFFFAMSVAVQLDNNLLYFFQCSLLAVEPFGVKYQVMTGSGQLVVQLEAGGGGSRP